MCTDTLSLFPACVSRMPWMFVMSTRVSLCMCYFCSRVGVCGTCVYNPNRRPSPLITCDINAYCGMQLIWMFMTKVFLSSISHLPLQAYTHISSAISVARLQEIAYDLIIGGVIWEKKSLNKPLQFFFFKYLLHLTPSCIIVAVETCSTDKYKGLD